MTVLFISKPKTTIMKKLLIAFSLVFTTVLIIHAQTGCTTQFIDLPMPRGIEEIISQCSKMEKVGELPNGDVIYYISGLPTQAQADSISEKEFINDGGDLILPNGYRSGEVLLMKSHWFNKWDVILFNPSKEYVMVSPHLNSSWEVEFLFKKGKEEIPAKTSLKHRYAVHYSSDSDRQKVNPRVYVNF